MISRTINIDIIIGAISGDVIGSSYEHSPKKLVPKNFKLFNDNSTFTDDTVLTIAVLECLINDELENIEKYLKSYAIKYRNYRFSPGFLKWAMLMGNEKGNSFGNGAAMRVSPLGALTIDEGELTKAVEKVTKTSHSHEESVKGAKAIAISIFKAKNKISKNEIKNYVSSLGYNLDMDFEKIKQPHLLTFGQNAEYICQTTVPIAISCFLQTNDYESCIRMAISEGGDTDTVACMAGGIAAAYYGGIPQHIKEETLKRIPEEFKDILNMI